MASQVQSVVQNNFTKGLLTEFTGLNFPENAATAANNCIFTLIGDVTRREGFDYESNYTLNTIDRTGKAVSHYKWDNAGGTGTVQFVVEQVGGTVYFYQSSAATTSYGISSNKSSSTINLSSFVASGGTFDATQECDYADGNGYLFIYHPSCDPIYCTYSAGTITGTSITLQIRDFAGIPEAIGVTTRPATLSAEHQYNLTNQGWTAGAAWTGTSTTPNYATTGSKTFTTQSGLAVTLGDTVNIIVTDPSAYPLVGTVFMSGVVTAYSGTTLTVNCTYGYGGVWATYPWAGWQIVQTNLGHITTWHTDVGNYPSNADVWWYFKDTTDLFNPTTTVSNVTLSTANAPQGHYILPAFSQNRGLVSSVAGLTSITTLVRPRTGCWFQGRVWYTGVDDQQSATGDEPYYTWSENIYFSQIVQTPIDFGSCYQQNDPTSETLFDVLPSDGGVISIPGCGPIYKLFSLQNAMLIFAANGVWYLSGSTGIGFSANDYSIVKLSAVKSLSGKSFVNINGLPMFWNEEGIYTVEPAKQGTGLLNSPLHVNPLEVTPLTVGTILTYYNNIPLQSKKYARGVYNPVDYVVQWVFKSTNDTSVTDRYTYDSILNFNNANKAFFPYTFDISSPTTPAINGIVYVSSPGGTGSLNSQIFYPVSLYVSSAYRCTFAEESNTTYLDWVAAGISENYTSSFTTGYAVHGQGQVKFQVPYLYLFHRLNGEANSLILQSVWDYANNGNSGKWSTPQQINVFNNNFDMMPSRIRLRGRGYVFQMLVTSVQGMPFDIMGWSVYETKNTGV